MIYKIDFLRQILEAAVNDPALAPIEKDGQITTFCNLGSFRIAQDLGLNLFWHDEADRPMLANEGIAYLDAHPEIASKFYDPATAWYLCDTGHLVFAALKDIPHGHIAALYPGKSMVKSAKWRISVPLCANIGKKNGIMGINFAFGEIPTFYLV